MTGFGCQWCGLRFDTENARFWHNVHDHPFETTEKYDMEGHNDESLEG